VCWYKEEGQERIAEGLSEERTERIEGQRFRERRRFFSFFFVVPRSIQEGTARVRICGADGDPSSSNKGGNFDSFLAISYLSPREIFPLSGWYPCFDLICWISARIDRLSPGARFPMGSAGGSSDSARTCRIMLRDLVLDMVDGDSIWICPALC
jgi:hypothetical protein